MHVLHLLDASVTWEQRAAVSQLLAKLPASDHLQSAATIDGAHQPRLASGGVKIAVLPRRLGMPALAAPAVRRFVEREAVDVIHAWGIEAATAARAACPRDMPVVVSVFHPGIAPRDICVLRAIGSSPGFAVCCAAERVRRRLVEQGVPFDQTVLIRPGVDFARVADLKRTGDRASLGLPAQGLLVLASPSPFDDGHDATLWSVMMHRYFDENARVVIYGNGPRIKRLRRLMEASEHSQIAVFTGDRIAFEALCAAADFLVIGSRHDVSTTCLAWAMACATPIIASATYATTEILAHDLNALLFKADKNWRRRGATLCAMYDRTENLSKIKEVARGQAYEVFSQRRAVEQHRQLYENLRKGDSPSKDISDPAMVGA